MAAQRSVTANVSRTVFQMSVSVSGRKRSGESTPQPTCTAWSTRNASGSSTSPATTAAVPVSAKGGTRAARSEQSGLRSISRIAAWPLPSAASEIGSGGAA